MSVLVLLLIPVACAYYTALDEYVGRPDSNYRYEDLNLTMNGNGWKGSLLKMYSQQWLTAADWRFASPGIPSDGIWWHYLNLIEPINLDPLKADTVLLYIVGGSNRVEPPISPDSTDVFLMSTLCLSLGIRGALLYDIPNQPIIFSSDPNQIQRVEDALIAYTWAHYLNDTSNSDWILQLPMTKSVVRTMDTIVDFWKDKATIKQYIPFGGSKRGFTTWLAGLVDDRVRAIIPMVYDFHNMIPSMHHMWKAYGGWTWAFRDYYDQGITGRIDSPEMLELVEIIDVYYYLNDTSRYNFPKLVITATNDQFFQNDNDYYWWDLLSGPKFRMINPNADHSLSSAVPSVLGTIVSFVETLISQSLSFPSFHWTITQNATAGVITVTNTGALLPEKVLLWSAPSWDPQTGATLLRDWRAEGGYPPQTQNPVWKESILTETTPGSGIYIGTRPAPTSGWEAFFIELTYPAAVRNNPFKLTTQVCQVVGDNWPFQDCSGSGCYGTLV